MTTKKIVQQWFQNWEDGNFYALPIAANFIHTSPFGDIVGKKTYFEMVEANKEKFLGYHFIIHDAMHESNKACVRYTAKQGNAFSLDVSEWYYCQNNLIEKIVSYYHIGEIRPERQLENPS
ncbi:MAG: nuclear transport factor 2 family protein [Chitinophagaceae bacterium]|nr:nuclear transport factor 2 family protein [Chitinophagaceae bacterium]